MVQGAVGTMASGASQVSCYLQVTDGAVGKWVRIPLSAILESIVYSQALEIVGQYEPSCFMSLALYRRHRLDCKGRHRHNSRTSEYARRISPDASARYLYPERFRASSRGKTPASGNGKPQGHWRSATSRGGIPQPAQPLPVVQEGQQRITIEARLRGISPNSPNMPPWRRRRNTG